MTSPPRSSWCTQSGGGAVVLRPPEFDCARVTQTREEMLILLNRGAASLLVDLGACSLVCACCGVPALVRVFRRARALGTAFHVIAPRDAQARRALEDAQRVSREPFPLVSTAEA
ncbi:STAS domain-containing protein [Streptomyces sp. CA-132043]|uniref:STAS domain-containing protein n=1 Tax=Streptomyces sp. CA-132043 TaxID=3240048 RepID=UPI003D8B4D2A